MLCKTREWALVGVLLLAMPWTIARMTDVAFAQGTAIATTQITDTIYRADGTAAGGTVLVSWPAFTTYSGQTVSSGNTSATLGAGGSLSLQLVPNAGSNPMGSYYTAVFHLDDGSVTREYWVVPVSTVAVSLNVVRSTVLPTSVAMQTVSKAYVDTAITAAVTGHPLDDSTPYVVKTGDTMTGPLVLPGDPTAATQAADKNYVDENVTAVESGLAQKVSLLPAGTQTVAQSPGTQLQVNNLNGSEYASQYINGRGDNGVANAVTSSDCASGCDVKVEHSYNSTEVYSPQVWNSTSAGGTHVEDSRGGERRDSYLNPSDLLSLGQDAGQVIDVASTKTAVAEHQQTGANNIFSRGLSITHEGLTGGSNLFPADVDSALPYFKSTYSALSVEGTYNTMGQHVLSPNSITCYGVGDCLIGAQFLTASGGFRDNSDEGSHPFDLQIAEDTAVFVGTCSSGCTTGSTVVSVTPTAAAGTQGEGRYLIDTNSAKVISTGQLTGGGSAAPGATASFSGTSFGLSTFLATTQAIQSQANDIAPGTVTIAIATSGVTAGFATNTAALPSSSGVACIADQPNSFAAHNYEMANYTVIDGTHLQMTLNKTHEAGATISVGGLCGYGLEQTVDTARGIRQVFPVIGSYSSTGLYYAGGLSGDVGIGGYSSAFLNVNLPVTAIVRSGGVVTVTTAGNLPVDLNGLTLTVAGVTDGSYNGSFAVTTTGPNTLTYSEAGANSTSSGGTVSILTGGYALYPMAEVLGVFNAATKKVDGQMTLAPNTVQWAANDPVEEPHYYQENVAPDIEFVSQTTPRPLVSVRSGIQYQLNVGAGIHGFTIANAAPSTNYLGNGGTHAVPEVAYESTGIWRRTLDAQAGDESVFSIHCNSHGCGKWNSSYNLFELDSNVGLDTVTYQPSTSNLTMSLRGTSYGFTPQAFTAGTINAGTVNATTLNGAVNASQLPVFVGSGSGHAAGAVPDPGTTAGTTRYLREDGTWVTPTTSGGGTSGQPSVQLAVQLSANLLVRYALTDGSGAPQDSSSNGNNATLPGGTANPTWTSQGLSCDGSSQYFNAPGTRTARTFVWASTLTPQLNSPSPAGAQYVTPFSVPDLSMTFAGTYFYGNHPSAGVNAGFNDKSDGTLQGTHTYALTLGTNSSTDPNVFYVDGVPTTYSSGRSAGAGAASGNYQVCGSNTGYPTYFGGNFYYFEAFSDEKTATQIQQETAAVTQMVQSRGVAYNKGPSPTIKDLYLSVGDSLTNGEGVNPSSQYITPSDTFDVMNFGLGNADTDDLFELFDAREGPLYRHNAGRNVIRLWAGTNDVSSRGGTAQQALDGIRAYCRKAKAAGFQTIVSDMISRTGHDTDMQTLDGLLTTQDTGCDLLLDLASNPLLGAVGAYANSTYFQGDNIHLTQAGQQNLVAPAETRAINLLARMKRPDTSPVVTTPTYAIADYDLYLPIGPAANSVAATLPDCSYFTGMTRSIKNVQGSGSNTVTVAPASGQLIDGSSSALTVANGATLVLRQVVLNRTTAGCSWVKVSNN